MSLGYIRKKYGVTAKRGLQVIADGEPGVIVGASGAHLRIRIEVIKSISSYHPTWNMQYLSKAGKFTFSTTE